MFTGKSIGKILFNCTNCGPSTTSPTKITTLFTITVKKYTSIQEHIDAISRKTKKCSHCNENISKTHKYNSPPRLRVISLSPQSQGVKISKSIMLETESGPITLNIRGAIYYTGSHFVSRIISPTGEVWYHDGIETKRQCVHEGHLINFTGETLKYQGNKICVSVIYSI